MSIAQRWKERVKKGEAGTPVEAVASGKGTMGKSKFLALLDSALAVSLAALSELRSKTDKIAHKRDKLLPEFEDYVSRLMGAGWVHDLLPLYMVWCLDCGAIEQGLKVCRYCLGKDIDMPEGSFNRPIPVIVADLVHDWAEEQFKVKASAAPYFDEVYDLVASSSGTDTWAMPDPVRAKYFRLKGLIENEAGNLASARDNLQKALDLKAQVKTVLAEVLKKIEAEADADGGSEDNA
jgi:hypothetical protein